MAELQLRYPTALSRTAPPQQNVASQGDIAGVCIDRRVFRKLRRRSREPEAHRSAPEALGTLSNEIASFSAERNQSTPRRAWSNDIASDCAVAQPLTPQQAWHNPSDEDLMRQGEAVDDENSLVRLDFWPCPGSPEVSPSKGHWALPGPGGFAEAGGWCQGPPRRRQGKADPVSRGLQMRALWSRDRFLRCREHRKFDLRGCGSPAPLGAFRRQPCWQPEPRSRPATAPVRRSAHSRHASCPQQGRRFSSATGM